MSNEDELLEITPCALPYGLDDKIFHCVDEDGEVIGEAYSYNDWVQEIEDISGVSVDLLG
jgi:hypothetical protein